MHVYVLQHCLWAGTTEAFWTELRNMTPDMIMIIHRILNVYRTLAHTYMFTVALGWQVSFPPPTVRGESDGCVNAVPPRDGPRAGTGHQPHGLSKDAAYVCALYPWWNWWGLHSVPLQHYLMAVRLLRPPQSLALPQALLNFNDL